MYSNNIITTQPHMREADGICGLFEGQFNVLFCSFFYVCIFVVVVIVIMFQVFYTWCVRDLCLPPLLYLLLNLCVMSLYSYELFVLLIISCFIVFFFINLRRIMISLNNTVIDCWCIVFSPVRSSSSLVCNLF